MKNMTKAKQLGLVLGMSWIFIACSQPSKTESTSAESSADLESAFFALTGEVQEEVMGTSAISLDDARADLLAKADTDKDGTISEAEKAVLKAKWTELKAQMKAELKAKLDKDKDGEVSQDEVKEGLDNLGSKIKEAILAMHEKMRAAQTAAQEKIQAACSPEKAAEEVAPAPAPAAALRSAAADLKAVNSDRPENENAASEGAAIKSDIKDRIEQCKTVRSDEREKLQQYLADSIDALQMSMDELKADLKKVEDRTAEVAAP